MYPPGIRVVKVSSRSLRPNPPIGSTGTVVDHWIKPKYGEFLVDCDQVKGKSTTGLWDCSSSHWRPINPDEGVEDQVEDKELEEVL